MTRRLLATVLMCLAICTPTYGVPLGTAVTYQGRLLNGGQPANGSYDMTFTLWTAVAGGSQIGNPVGLGTSVTNGVFTVQLNAGNEFGATAFDGQARWLQIAVNGTVLSPRQPVTAAPYALYALSTQGAALTLPFSGSYMGSDQNAMSITQTGLGYAANFASTSSGNYYGTLGVSCAGTGPSLFVTHSNGATCARFQNVVQANGVPTVHATTNGSGVALYGDASIGTNGIGVSGNGHGSGDGVRGSVDGSGVAIRGTSSGTGRVAFFQNTNASNTLTALRVDTNSTNTAVAAIAAVNTGNGHAATFQTGSNTLTINGDAMNSSVSGLLNLMKINNTSTNSVWIGGGGGNVGIGTGVASLPVVKLQVDGGTDASITNTTGGYFLIGSTAGANIVMDNNEIIARNNGAASTLYLNNDGGDVRIGQNGGSSTVYVKVLAVTGADLAEKFPISEDREAAVPGTVMEIDPDQAGKVRMSRIAYNRRVAGVVSGAGDIPVGAILGNLPGHEDAPPIALSGRVWVRCDAGGRAIAPGDFLTTSDTPGCAMAVADRERAQGAVIGKAMSSLAKGENGLVLVLVNLQ